MVTERDEYPALVRGHRAGPPREAARQTACLTGLRAEDPSPVPRRPMGIEDLVDQCSALVAHDFASIVPAFAPCPLGPVAAVS